MTPNTAKPNDFFIPLPGVGQFRFNRRTYGAQVRMDAELLRILGPNAELSGDKADSTMSLHAQMISHYNALMVACPPGWEDLEAIDLTEDPSLDAKILELYYALRAHLLSFRLGRGVEGGQQAGQAAGAPGVEDDGVLGAAPLPASADGPALAGPGA